MSHLLERLQFFKRVKQTFSNGHGIVTEEDRQWEEGYRQRWRFDKIVRSTHGVNCTGSCSWNIHIKNGLVAFETQATDYPRTRPDMPNHEPRGCQRGASYSWYLYSPHRVKYPLIRGRLLNLWQQHRQQGKDPVEAWTAIMEDSDQVKQYQSVRGLGGLVRASWETVNEIIAAANIYTIKKYGPDRIAGFSPIPAMSMISYAAGGRYLSLIGAAMLSFYDWYCDLPPSSPQVWGEQTDVPEAADWYNATYIIVSGANLPMTRTPDAHFYSEVRYKGAKVVAMAPDYAEYVKFADLWMPVRQGTDSAVFMAMAHVVLKEFFIEKQVPYFQEYARLYTDLPMQVILRPIDSTDLDDVKAYASDRFLRASDFDNSLEQTNHPEWKTIVYDQDSQSFVCPNGSIGFRWGEDGLWNLKPQVGQQSITAELTCLGQEDGIVMVGFPNFSEEQAKLDYHKVPARQFTINGETVWIASVFDLLVAQYGVDRGFADDNIAKDYQAISAYTPAWQETVTGVKSADVIRTAREFADNAAKTKGKSMVILGAGINHWYHNDMNYRAIMNLLHLCGCVGQSGGGWAHYVGQEKLRPQAGWAPIAFGLDWHKPSRQMNGTSFFYFHTDQWRYERVEADQLLSPTAKAKYKGHQLADYNIIAQRLGWLPSAPHFNQSPLDLCQQAIDNGADSEQAISDYVAKQWTDGKLELAYEDIDNPVNFPRNLFVWRSNLLGCSAKGHEYFLKHLLGAQNGVLGDGEEGQCCQEIKWHEQAPMGKLDLLVDINFRLNSTGAYSDIILPTATWYEKHDLNTTDMHPFIHPLSEAVDPGWESRTDWQIFKGLAKVFSELSAKHLSGTYKDLVAVPLMHDSPTELGQALGVQDWKHDDNIEAIQGKNMPVLKVVERQFTDTYKKYTTLGPLLRDQGNQVKGIAWDTTEEYEFLEKLNYTEMEAGVSQGFPSLADDIAVCEAILSLAPETNGEVAYKGWQALSKKTGLEHTHLSSTRRDDKIRFRDIQAQPRKIITAPTWSGIESEEVSYTAAYTNIHEYIPFRTLTGRAQFYQDHEWMLDFGEGFCCFRPPVDLKDTQAMPDILKDKPHLRLNWITPHSKWGIHSTYNDNQRMLNLSRGGPVVWVAEVDAKSIGLKDNDWVEAVNANGATVARVVVSQRIPKGAAIMYHAQEKIINVPGSPTTEKRGGILNSVTRVIVKPTHMIGGYAQLAYSFNYYGTVGSQRDEYVLLHKIDDDRIDWLERELTPEKEQQRNPAVLK